MFKRYHRDVIFIITDYFLYNIDSACQFSNVVAVIAFLASIGELDMSEF